MTDKNKWKNHTEQDPEELVDWMKKHDINIESIGAIVQDTLGCWHLFYIGE